VDEEGVIHVVVFVHKDHDPPLNPFYYTGWALGRRLGSNDYQQAHKYENGDQAEKMAAWMNNNSECPFGLIARAVIAR
jgi:hypothetical protein